MEENKKDQKVYFIVFVVFILILLGVLGYFVFYVKDEVQAPEEEKEVTKVEEKQEKTTAEEIDMSGWQTYENKEFGFSLKYPKEWGIISEKNIAIPEGSKIYKSLRLKSEKINQYIQIQIVEIKDKNDFSVIDYPQKYITENNKYIFYYSSSNDCIGMPECKIKEINKDIQKTVDTFKLNTK
jgi:hypothetical protein